MAKPTYAKKEATEADKALLAKILGEAKPYVAKKQKELNKPRETWEQKVKENKPEEITKGKADYVFVDAKRNPAEVTWAVVPQSVVWHVCRSFAEFMQYILQHGLPKHVSFDYDLTPADSKDKQTALNVIQWLEAYCITEQKLMPEWSVHTKMIINQQLVEGKLVSATSKVKKAVNANNLNSNPDKKA